MFEKNDHRFLHLLDSPEELEKRLRKLHLGRKIMTFYALFGAAGAVLMLFVGKNVASGFPSPDIQAMVMILGVMSFFFPIICWIKAGSFHAEIHTLLIFKKLNDSRPGEKHG